MRLLAIRVPECRIGLRQPVSCRAIGGREIGENQRRPLWHTGCSISLTVVRGFIPGEGIPMIRSLVRGFAAAIVLGAFALGPGGRAFAQVKPGDFITWQNASKVKELVSPGVYQRIEHGMSMKIEKTERIEWPPPYQEATEKYSSQVRLSPDHRSLIGYVAGEPFPIIDANDPYAADKVIWNEVFRPISTDDYDLRFFDCDTVYWGRNKSFFEIYDTEIGHYAGYNEVGRTEVEPMPIDPDFTRTNRYYLALLYPVLSPATDRGTGILKFRFANPNRDDDVWTWTPGARRLRRLNYDMMDTASGAQAYDPNHYEAWSGKPEDYDFRFLGEKTMLAAVDVHHGRDPRCPTDGGASHCPDAWQLRHMYVIEARPRAGREASPLYSREIIYIDSEADFPMYVDMYDHAGRLFKNYTSWMNYADRAERGSRIAIYPFKREFQVGSSTTDLQGGLSSVCYHPALNAPTRDSWFINMGAVDRNWFTPEAMAAAAEGGHAVGGD